MVLCVCESISIDFGFTTMNVFTNLRYYQLCYPAYQHRVILYHLSEIYCLSCW